MKTKVTVFADLRYPFTEVIVEQFKGTLKECEDWAFQKTHEMLEFFPKVNILQVDNPWGEVLMGRKHDFSVMSTKSKHFLSFTFEEDLNDDVLESN